MTSNAAQDYQKEDFLVDFLYADRPRIASLSAQLFDDGHLTGTKKSSAISSEIAGKVSGGIPGIAKGETAGTDKTQESIERQFDATWSGPLNVLRELNELGYLGADVQSARLGQVVLVQGALQILDLRMVQKLWRPILTQENAKALASVSKAERANVARAAAETKGLVEIVELLPHMLQMRIRSGEYACWATLDPEQMTVNPADLVFKHGALIPGEWSILGLLDAQPSHATADLLSAVQHTQGPLVPGMLQMLSGLREMLGRAPDDYGITPLAIYRTVKHSALA